MKKAYLGLGSNLGVRQDFLAGALAQIRAAPQVSRLKTSSVYETKPVGLLDQPDFLNLAAEIETNYSPEEVLALCLGVEAALGRERKIRWGPRTIDIDLLWYEGEYRNTESLMLPHPRMKERSFVLAPLAELAPDLKLDGETVATLAARLNSENLRRVGRLD